VIIWLEMAFAYPGFFWGVGVSTNSVEYRWQIERWCGGCIPLIRGSAQFANVWNPYFIRLRMYFPRNWEFDSALSKLRNFWGWGVWTPIPLPSVRHWGDGTLIFFCMYCSNVEWVHTTNRSWIVCKYGLQQIIRGVKRVQLWSWIVRKNMPCLKHQVWPYTECIFNPSGGFCAGALLLTKLWSTEKLGCVFPLQFNLTLFMRRSSKPRCTGCKQPLHTRKHNWRYMITPLSCYTLRNFLRKSPVFDQVDCPIFYSLNSRNRGVRISLM
jgi:hypothetical protein